LREISKDIALQAKILSEIAEFKIDRFSFHRPTKDVLRANIKIDGLINTYAPDYFSFVEQLESEKDLDVKYVADSMHRWNYGYPNEEMLNSHRKLQILIHPYSWTGIGHDNLDNFRSLLQEKQKELIDTIDSECKHFCEVRNAL
jgi:hypothetical protein